MGLREIIKSGKLAFRTYNIFDTLRHDVNIQFSKESFTELESFFGGEKDQEF